ncbi:MAG: hypothetical protein QM496_14355 [Verrucomicrobiota bacterium]
MGETENKQSEQIEGAGKSEGKNKWRGRLRKLLVLVLALGLIAAGVGYFGGNWLIVKTEKLVVATLAQKGVYLGYDESSREPLRGMVFENLAVYSSEKRDVPLLVISDIAIFPSLRHWLMEGGISVRVTLHDSEIRMLVEGKEVEKVENVTARIKASMGGLQMERMSALMNGVDYHLTGGVNFGSRKGKGGEAVEDKAVDKAVDKVKKGPLIDFAFWEKFAHWIEVDSKGGEVKIRGEFDIDTGDLAAMTVKADFSGDSFGWHGLDFDHLRAQVDYIAKDKLIDVTALDVLSKEGKMNGDFSYHLANKVLEVGKLDGQTDVLTLINNYLGKPLVNDEVFVMVKPPHLGLSGILDFSDLIKSDMKVEFLPADEVVVKVAGELISMKKLSGAVVFSDGRVSVVQPEVFAKMNEGEFHLSGYLQLLSEESGQENEISAELSLAGKSIVWKGLVLDHAKSKVIFSGRDQSVIFKGLDVAHQGKPFGGDLHYRIADKTLEMVKMESQIDFLQLTNDLLAGGSSGKRPEGALIQAPHLQVNGLVDFGDLNKSDVKVKFLNQRDVVVEVGGRRIEMKALKGELAFKGGAVSTVEPGLVARMADGGISLSGRLEVMGGNKAYQAALKLEDVSLDELKALASAQGKEKDDVKVVNNEAVKQVEEGEKEEAQDEGEDATKKQVAQEEVKKEVGEGSKDEDKTDEGKKVVEKSDGNKEPLQGRLFFEFDGSGDAGTPLRQGKGLLRIDEAQFYAMPMFGTFFDTFNKVIPAFGRREDGETHGTQKLTGTYLIEDAKIRSEDLRIRGNLSQVEVKVSYDVAKDHADIDGKIELTGAVGVVTTLASNLLEIEGKGPMRNLKWGLKNLSASGLVKGGVKGVGKTGEGVIKAGGATVKGAAAMTSKGAEKMIEGAGKVGEGLMKALPFGIGKKGKKEKKTAGAEAEGEDFKAGKEGEADKKSEPEKVIPVPKK